MEGRGFYGGGGLSKTGRPEKSKSPKNKDRNYSIISYFTTVFTCTYYIKISGRYSPAVCYLSILIIAGTQILFI